jgi:hypothetical protein
MIQFTLSYAGASDMLELRTSAAGSNTAAKPPLIVRPDDLTSTLLILLRASQMEAAHV